MGWDLYGYEDFYGGFGFVGDRLIDIDNESVTAQRGGYSTM